MRFRSTNRTSSYMGRPFQLRMIMMIVALGIVILAIRVTSRPSFWSAMFPDEAAVAEGEKSGSSRDPETQTQPGLEGIPQVQLDEVLIAQTENEREPETPESSGKPEQDPDAESTLPVMPEQPQVAGVKIDPQRFSSIEDYSVSIPPEEKDAFFYTIYHAGRVPLKELQQAGVEDVTHAAIRGKPEYYRGKVITIEGKLRRLERIVANQNAYGIEEFYNAWIITPTSNNIPYRVVARFKEESLPVRQTIEESVPVRVSGYFFKVQAYATEDGKPQMTPVLIARRVTKASPRPEPISLSEDSDPGRWLFLIFSVVFAIAIWSAYRSTVGARRMRQHRKEVLESDSDLSELQGEESVDPEDALRQMEKDE